MAGNQGAKVAAGEVSASDEVSTLLEQLRQRGIQRAKIGGFDVDGVLRGKYVSLSKLESALRQGFGFCDVIFGWDVNDALYDNTTLTGWHSGYPDAQAVLDPHSLRDVPWESSVVALLCDFRKSDGQAHPACPRSLLKRVIQRLDDSGYRACCGVEFEFFLFKETRDSLAQKGFRNLTPLDPGMFGYSWVRTSQDSELMQDIWEGCRTFGIELEGLHTETGPGVYEAAIAATDALAAADQAALFKTLLKHIAHRHGIAVTFMAKCMQDLPGSSGHIHQSLWKADRNAFFDPDGPHGMSKELQHYCAGQLALMRDWTALFAPTVNSYKRFVPGLWAPVGATWGVENRTCSIRVAAPNQARSIRVEYRQTAADINPYIAVAASLAAGLWGIERALEPPSPSVGDAGSGSLPSLPTSLREATELLRNNEVAGELLGQEFVDHYIRTRDWEARQFERAVCDWELHRYFEAI